MASKEYDNQHYVPKSYFRAFSNNGKSICLLCKSNGKTVEHASINDQASESKFYGASEVEKNQITPYDTKHFNIRKLIIENENSKNPFDHLNETQINTLRENIVFQYNRTAKARINNKPMIDYLSDSIVPQFEDKPEGWPDEIYAGFKEIMQKAFSPEEFKKSSQVIDLENSQEAVGEISDLQILTLINNTALPFIFSDSPVIFSNIFLKEFRKSSITTPTWAGIFIVYPISPKIAILAYDANTYKVKNQNLRLVLTKTSDIDNINKLQLHEADSLVYFNDYNFKDYVHHLWTKEKQHFIKMKSRLIHGIPSFTLDGNLINRVSVLEKTGPSFFPKLSFLNVRSKFLSKSISFRDFEAYKEGKSKKFEREYSKTITEFIYFPFRKAIFLKNNPHIEDVL